jgi:hypothetical protein
LLLTKKYFKNFQYFIVGGCILSAIVVGSAQSYLIVRAIRRNTGHNKSN